VQRAAEQRGAARSVREDTGCGAALAAVEPIESGRKKKQRRRSAPTLRSSSRCASAPPLLSGSAQPSGSSGGTPQAAGVKARARFAREVETGTGSMRSTP
jgi:hypothetical protein